MSGRGDGSGHDGPGEADRDLLDDESTDTEPCPACGEPVYEGADRCPACGEWIIPRGGPFIRPQWWWIALILAAGGVLLWALL